MSRIFRSLPPKGTRLGIAFSGGLDTRCAVAWLARAGARRLRYTADLAQPDEKDPGEIPPIARCRTGPRRRGSSTAARPWRARACRHPVRRLPPVDRRAPKYFNTTPLGRAVTTTAIVRAMREDDVHVFGDGSARTRATTSSASIATASWSTPSSASTSRGSTRVRDRVRRPHRDERVPRAVGGCPTRWAPRRPTAPTRTCSARPTRRRTSSSSKGIQIVSRSWASPSGSATS
jgi:hypothetical protein